LWVTSTKAKSKRKGKNNNPGVIGVGTKGEEEAGLLMGPTHGRRKKRIKHNKKVVLEREGEKGDFAPCFRLKAGEETNRKRRKIQNENDS